jgi:hypothetical protein
VIDRWVIFQRRNPADSEGVHHTPERFNSNNAEEPTSLLQAKKPKLASSLDGNFPQAGGS